MLQRIQKIWSEKGQGIVEYALILAFVVAIAAVALTSNSGMGQAIQDKFTEVADTLTGNNNNNNNNNQQQNP